MASGYNGLLENPVFAAVLGTEVAETKKQGLSTLPASLIGGGVGYGVFLLLHETGFVNFLHLPPVQDYTVWDAFLMVPLALIGLVLALLTARVHEGLRRLLRHASRTASSCGRSSPA